MKVARHGKAAALTADQLEALLDAAAPRYRCLFALQRWTAARISEALSLTWADVAGGYVTFRRANTKTKSTRQLQQAPRLQAELATWRLQWQKQYGCAPKASDAVFPRPDTTTTPQTRQAADLALRKLCAQLGIVGVTVHSFRRTAAQDAVNRGCPLHAVQAMTGHKRLDSLGEYLAATPEQVMEAIGG